MAALRHQESTLQRAFVTWSEIRLKLSASPYHTPSAFQDANCLTVDAAVHSMRFRKPAGILQKGCGMHTPKQTQAAAQNCCLHIGMELSHTPTDCAGHPVQDIAQIGPVCIGDIPAAAVDFHVSDIVEEVAAFSTSSSQGPATTAAMLKKAMWQCSSGVTTKASFDWIAGWDCVSELQNSPDAATSSRLVSRMSARSDPQCNADSEIRKVWLKEASSVSAWARKYLEKRFR